MLIIYNKPTEILSNWDLKKSKDEDFDKTPNSVGSDESEGTKPERKEE